MFLQTYACINAVMHVLYMSMIEDKSWIEKVKFFYMRTKNYMFLVFDEDDWRSG